MRKVSSKCDDVASIFSFPLDNGGAGPRQVTTELHRNGEDCHMNDCSGFDVAICVNLCTMDCTTIHLSFALLATLPSPQTGDVGPFLMMM